MITACICFRNEGEEVRNTIKSIRETTQDMPILIVDDYSNDGYDYLRTAVDYGCKYHRMTERVGSVGTKDWAGRNVDTEYFVLLDGHMRFYMHDWDKLLEEALIKNPMSIISSRTIYLSKENGEMVNKDNYTIRSMCARVEFGNGFEFDPKWTDAEINERDGLCDVPCVLGACYAISKAWWERIDGLNGLKTYGLEETYMSIKTWLCGGSCKVTKNFGAGHVYRSINPNSIPSLTIDYNRLVCGYVFDTDFAELCMNLSKRIGYNNLIGALKMFEENFDNLKAVKEYFKAHNWKFLNWYRNELNSKA